MNGCVAQAGFDPTKVAQTVNQWIVAETARTLGEVTENLLVLRFNESAGAIYRFVWDVFCDWYLELIKPVLNGPDEVAKAEVRATAAWTRDQILKLLHPYMPFITEELWARTAEGGELRASLLIEAPWPNFKAPRENEVASAEMNWVVQLISSVRSVRAEMNVPAAAKVSVLLKDANADSRARLERHRDAIMTLARAAKIEVTETVPQGSAQFVLNEATAALPLGDVIDFAKERQRLEKELKKTETEIARFDAKLGDAAFVARAPQDVIDEQKEKRAEAEATMKRLRDAVARLG
jgi:valyl-tRNA synthetase